MGLAETPRVAVVTAAAQGWRAQNDRAVELVAAAGGRAVFVAVNDVGVVHPDPLLHWASLHIDQMEHPDFQWAQKRLQHGLRSEYTRWSQSHGALVDQVSRVWRGGSSGLLGLDVALNGLECDGAILCGIPMDARPNQLNPRSKDGWGAFQRFRHAWEQHRHQFADRARSMSGWTRELLGAPSVRWIRDLTRR